jgi:Amidase
VCKAALKTFESIGCVVEEAQPDYPLDSVWRAVLRIRGWQQGGGLLAFYNDPVKRAQLKPEAIYEIELGMKQSAYDITAASVVRSEWYQAVRRFFDRYDYFIVPTAQLFPFDVDLHWPQEIAGKRMETYHEWMKAVLLVSMSGCPALAVPAGFGSTGLPGYFRAPAAGISGQRAAPGGDGPHRRGASIDLRLGALCQPEIRPYHRHAYIRRVGPAQGAATEIRVRAGLCRRSRERAARQEKDSMNAVYPLIRGFPSTWQRPKRLPV